MLSTVNEQLSISTIISRNKSSRIEFLSNKSKFVEIIVISIKTNKNLTLSCDRNQKYINSKVSNFDVILNTLKSVFNLIIPAYFWFLNLDTSIICHNNDIFIMTVLPKYFAFLRKDKHVFHEISLIE